MTTVATGPVPDPLVHGVVDAALVESIERHVGRTTEHDLGIVTARTIGRYALACGETDPVHFDHDAAVARGHRGVVAPLNMLPSVADWGVGAPETGLRPDGTPLGEAASGLPERGYRLMGGGELMEFSEPLIAGDHVMLSTAMSGVEVRDSRSGPMAVVSYRNDYRRRDGVLLMSCTRSVLVRGGGAS